MKVVTFTSFKGGAGKTTALMVACSSLVELGHKVCLLEADENRPLTEWKANAIRHNAWNDNVQVYVGDDMESLDNSFTRAEEEGFDIALIDTHGGGSEINNTIITSSDFIVLPSTLTQLDIDETLKTYTYIVELLLSEKLETGSAILKQRVPASKLTLAQKAAAEVLDSLPTFSEPLYDRDAFASMKLRGLLHGTLKKYENDKMSRLQKNNYKRACNEADQFAHDIIKVLEG